MKPLKDLIKEIASPEKSVRDICDETGLSKKTVHDVLKRFELPYLQKRNIKPDLNHIVCKLAHKDKTLYELAKQANCTYQYAYVLAVRFNLPHKGMKKPLTDVERYKIRKNANPELSIERMAKMLNRTRYIVEKFMIEEDLPFKSYAVIKEKRGSEFFSWDKHQNLFI